jgi:predicted transcriptional regulator
MKQPPNLKKQCADQLKRMSDSVSFQDKEDAAKQLGVHLNTVNNYIQGSIGNVDKALELIEFLTERIIQKTNRLKQVTTAA